MSVSGDNRENLVGSLLLNSTEFISPASRLLQHAKKLAVQTAEELARDKEYSHLRGKYVQVTDERGNLVYKVSLPDGMPVSRKLNGVRLDGT